MRRRWTERGLAGVLAVLSVACAGDENGRSQRAGGGSAAGGAGADGSTGGGAPMGGTAGSDYGSGLGGVSVQGSADAAGCMASQSAEATFEPVTLAFAFDVSGSMGKLDFPYHDPELKWQPVVDATKAFFGDPASAGISASMTFFPVDADADVRCDPAEYDDPDVPITALPSGAFGLAIDAITPTTADEWRGGTPTLAVITGTLDFIQPLAEGDGSSRYAIVLVSDGYPQSCDDNSIDSVVAVVEDVSERIPTYVIGVSNPPDGPDTVSDLDRIAVAGRTGHAFLIQTGDPEATKDAFGAAVRGIRSASVSCEFVIPEPPAGLSFNAELANVTYTSVAAVTELAYDETCAETGAWRYDDAAAPTRMVLCDAICETVQADPDATLSVEFGCGRRDVLR